MALDQTPQFTTLWLSVGELQSFLTAPKTGCAVSIRVKAELDAALVPVAAVLTLLQQSSLLQSKNDMLHIAG